MEQLSLSLAIEQRCVKCLILKRLEDFNWAHRSRGKRQTTCRDCFREYNRQRYIAKREYILAQTRAYRDANPEEVRARKHAQYWRDVETSRAKGRANAAIQNAKPERQTAKREWRRRDRAANPEKWRESGRREYQQNRLGRIETQWRRRAQKLATMCAPVTVALLQAKWEHWGGRCWICGDVAVEFDHVKPLVKGGAHMLCNLRPACRSCNARKHDTWPLAA